MAHKSEKSHAVLDVASRKQKARKIISLIAEGTDLKKAKILDVGTGAGTIASELSKIAKQVDSVDLYDERLEKKGYTFHKVADEALPFKDSSFDVVISNHVIEHVPNQSLHAQELLRVLKPGGLIYLATPNKAWFTDPHHKLPFISWLPRSASNLYLKKVRGKEWDIFPVSHFKVMREFSHMEVTKGVPHFLKNTSEDQVGSARKLLTKLPHRVLAFLQHCSPTLIYLIRKPEAEQ